MFSKNRRELMKYIILGIKLFIFCTLQVIRASYSIFLLTIVESEITENTILSVEQSSQHVNKLSDCDIKIYP